MPALKRALGNIERFYPLVGVLEAFDGTVQLAERMFPQFFTGLGREAAIQAEAQSE